MLVFKLLVILQNNIINAKKRRQHPKKGIKKMSETLEMVIQELQLRIGQITSQYETQMALLKVQANQAIKAFESELEGLKKKGDTSGKAP